TRCSGCGTASAWMPPADRGNEDDFAFGADGREHALGLGTVHHHHQVRVDGAVGAKEPLPGFGVAAGQVVEGGPHGGTLHLHRVPSAHRIPHGRRHPHGGHGLTSTS